MKNKDDYFALGFLIASVFWIVVIIVIIITGTSFIDEYVLSPSESCFIEKAKMYCESQQGVFNNPNGNFLGRWTEYYCEFERKPTERFSLTKEEYEGCF